MMEKTWRWFGKKDKITLPMLRQIGVKGIVTALHDVPNGEIWTMEAINDLKSYIESYGLRWSVVESLPVCEAIKYAGAEREQLIENYKVSLTNLGKCGIKTVCYNFMPVIDWIRTDLQHPWPDGTSSLYYDRIRFAYFDIRQRFREIGIRKVNGATPHEILLLLFSRFIVLILGSIVVAVPIAWLVIEIYRENFIECASLAWWLFAAAFLITGGVAFFTLLWQSRKAALANPVKALKNE